MKTRLVLAEDQSMIREGLRSLLNGQPDLEVIAEASDGREVVKQVLRLKPDVVLMDVSLPQLNGIEATRQITTAMRDVKVLALADESTNRTVGEMFQAGASGYLLKSATFAELMRALENIVDGGTYLGAEAAEFVVQHYIRREGNGHGNGSANANGNGAGHPALTPREREVLQLLAEGHVPREIAEMLQVSLKTIDTHRHQIMKKCRFRGLADLTRYALREGLTDLHIKERV